MPYVAVIRGSYTRSWTQWTGATTSGTPVPDFADIQANPPVPLKHNDVVLVIDDTVTPSVINTQGVIVNPPATLSVLSAPLTGS